jgi:hypothetical protein
MQPRSHEVTITAFLRSKNEKAGAVRQEPAGLWMTRCFDLRLQRSRIQAPKRPGSIFVAGVARLEPLHLNRFACVSKVKRMDGAV